MSRPWNKPRGGPNNQADQPPRWLPSAGGITVVCLLLCGLLSLPIQCSPQQRPTQSSSAGDANSEYDLACLAAFDISGSMSEAEKRAAYQFVSQLLSEAVEKKAQMPIWEYAETCAQRAELDVEVRKDVIPELEKLIGSSRGVWGTRPDLALDEFKAFLTSKRPKCSSVVLFLVTDGEMHDPTAAAELSRELAELSDVDAFVVGPVDTEQWTAVRHTFSSFGDRLVIFGAADRRRALDDTLRLLRRGDAK
jgi:hypothetical protein